GSSYCVNVLGNDSSPRPINCTLLGDTDVKEDQYGSVHWSSSCPCGASTSIACSQGSTCTADGPPGRCITYTLNGTLPPGNPLTDMFTYTIVDCAGCMATGTVTVNIASPVANPDPLETCRVPGSSYCVNVLGNDQSPRPINCA